MGFYPTTENMCLMMGQNHITKSYEYIIICHDELYIALTTSEENIHIVNDKYKIKINPDVYQGHSFPYDPGGTMICLFFSKTTNFIQMYAFHSKSSSY